MFIATFLFGILAVAAQTSTPTRPPGPAPCAGGTAVTCGTSSDYCVQACAWVNASCVSVDRYPTPSNASLAALCGPMSPLIGADYVTVSFYGDSITFLNVYEPLISAALAASPYISNVAVRIINQGVNGGTLHDLILGYSPWGHLDPGRAQTNITFA